MNLFLTFIIGLIVGGVGVWVLMKLLDGARSKEIDIPERFEEKAENIAKIKKYISSKDKITNDEIQNLLGVSDTTIGRYLEELEADKVIKQVGKTGQAVYYSVNK